MAGDRTEKPTPKRLEDARKKGQVARTREAAQALSLLIGVAVLGWTGGPVLSALTTEIVKGIERMGENATVTLDGPAIVVLAREALTVLATTAGPLAVAIAVAVIAAHVLQGGWVFASEALGFRWERLSPAAGIKRLGLSQGGVDLLRNILAVAIIAVLGTTLVLEFLPAAADLSRRDPLGAAAATWDAGAGFMRNAAFGLLLLAGGDYLVQRQRHLSSLKMTKQEIRDESRLMEGSPEIKARVRRVQREMTRRRMMKATQTATVVITNPTHYAVALEYRRESMTAPRVVAKGQDHLALRIKAVAREHHVPMVENVQLARALYATADVGETIPGPLFEAVAEVLAYLIRIKQLVL